jgi:hypothetical protein
MTESEYYPGEIADADLDALADAGDFYLEESGFSEMPSSSELQKLAEMGETLLFFEWLRML